ncbi:hypothetical protein GPJ56_002094 [Histomonas meleagridis]|nr:hypothetical protein GPJ56_002094 [Histomonas meleagridis]
MDSIVTLKTSTSITDSNGKPFRYSTDFTGFQMLMVGCYNLKIPYKPNELTIIVVTPKQTSYYIQLNVPLSVQGVNDGDSIYIVPQNTPLPFTEEIPELPPVALPELKTGATPELLRNEVNIGDDINLNIQTKSLLNDNNDMRMNRNEGTSKKINLFTVYGFKDDKGIECQYEVSFPFAVMVQRALSYLHQRAKGQYSILLCFSPAVIKWFDEDRNLEYFNPVDGMLIRVFKKNQSLSIYCPHFGTNSFLIDITKPVNDVVQYIANDVCFADYRGYTLVNVKRDNEFEPLDGQLSIPQQRNNFEELQFRRMYFVFSKETFCSLENALIAYRDMLEALVNKDSYITPDEAIELAALAILCDPSKQPEQKKLFSPRFQGYINDSMLKPALTYFDSHPKPSDQINAIRMFLGKARRIPDLASIQFSCTFIQKTHDQKDKIQVYAHFSPIRLAIINRKTKIINANIPYFRIRGIEVNEPTVTINYLNEGRVPVSVELRFERKFNIFLSYINQYSSITKQIFEERVLKKVQNKQISIDTIDEEDKIGLHTTNGPSKPGEGELFVYDRKFTAEQVLKLALRYLNEKEYPDQKILIHKYGQAIWPKPDQFIGTLGIDDGMTINIIRVQQQIRFKLTDGTVKAVIFKNPDLSEPIRTIIGQIFTKLHMPKIIGYSIFREKEESEQSQKQRTQQYRANLVALDPRLSIPEQCTDFESKTVDDVKLYFKRQYMTLTRDDLSSAAAAKYAYIECKDYINNNDCGMTEDQVIEVAILSVLIEAKVPGDTSYFNPDKFASIVPSNFKVNSKILAKFKQRLAKYEKMDNINAIRRYIRIVRDLPRFGAHTFHVLYRPLPAKSRPHDGYLFVCPIYLFVEENNKRILTIPYKFVINLKTDSKRVQVIYGKENTTELSTIEFKTKRVVELSMLISGSLTIFRELIVERQISDNKRVLEDSQKLQGIWIDENGVSHSPMIDLQPTNSLQRASGLDRVWLELATRFDDIIKQLSLRLNLVIPKEPGKDDYAIMINIHDRIFRFIQPDGKLGDAKPVRGSILFVIPRFPIISVVNSLNVEKKIRLDISMKVRDLVQVISHKFNTTLCKGYTLYTIPEDGGDPKPLDLNLSLPEQTVHYENLLFKRRFFAISQIDFITVASKLATFNDIKEHILTSGIQISVEDAIHLAYYSLFPNSNVPVTPQTVPNDITPLLPRNIKCKSGYNKQLIKYFTTEPITDKDVALEKYVQLARKIPTFGCEYYPAIYEDNSNPKKTVRRNIQVLISPTSIIFSDPNGKEQYITIDYKKLISPDVLDPFLSFRYTSSPFEPLLYADIESEGIVSKISSTIEEYQRIITDVSKTTSGDGKLQNIEKINVLLYKGNEEVTKENAQSHKFSFDKRQTGDKVASLAAKHLKLNTKGQYLCLLQYTTDHKRWLYHDEYFGKMNPYDDMVLQVFSVNFEITVQNSSRVKKNFFIDITNTVADLIPKIALQFSIDDYIGYSLFFEEEGVLQPLMYQLSIYEQIKTRKMPNLIFKHRYFLINPFIDELSFDVLMNTYYQDVRSTVLSGNHDLNDTEIAELAIFQIYTDPSNDDETHKIEIPTNLAPYLPKGMKPKQALIDTIRKALTDKSKITTRNEACREFISRAMNNTFACAENYHAVMIEDEENKDENTENKEKKDKKDKNKDKNAQKDKNRSVTISVSVKGIDIKEFPSQSDIEFIPYEELQSRMILKDLIIFTKKSYDGKNFVIKKLQFRTKSASLIYNYIETFIEIVNPQFQERNERLKAFHQATKEIGETIVNVLYLETANALGHWYPTVFPYLLTEKVNTIIDRLADYYNIKNAMTYRLVAQYEDGNFQVLPADQIFGKYNISNSTKIYLLELLKDVRIINDSGLVTTNVIDISLNVEEACRQIASNFNYQFHECFTLYANNGNGFDPLYFDQSVISQTNNFNEFLFKRRFFIFPQEAFFDNETLFSVYEDCHRMVINNKIQIPQENDMLCLAVYTLYYESSNPLEVTQRQITNLTDLIPSSVQSGNDLLRRFDNILKSIPPMSRTEAAAKYISYVCDRQGFGVEKYNIRFTDLIDTLKRPRREAVLLLGPFEVSIKDDTEIKVIASFDYKWITSYEIEDTNKIILKFNDHQSNYHHVIIEVDKVQPIVSFISTMYYYTTSSSIFLESAEQIRGQLSYIISRKGGNEKESAEAITIQDTSYDNFDVDVTTFDNYNAFDVNFDDPIERVEFATFDSTNYDDSVDSHYTYTKVDPVVDIYGAEDGVDNYSWRTTDEGLKYTRASRVLEKIKDNFEELNSHLDSTSLDEFTRRLDFIYDNLNDLNPEETNEFKEKLKNITGKIDELREKAQLMDPLDTKYTGYNDEIKTTMRDIMGIFGSAKDALNNELQLCKKQQYSYSQISDNGQISAISKNLIDISEATEALTVSIISKYMKFQEMGTNPSNIISSLKEISTNLTKLARNYTENEDQKLIDKYIIPLLGDLIIKLKQLKDICFITDGTNDIIEMEGKIENIVNSVKESLSKVSENRNTMMSQHYKIYTGSTTAVLKSAQIFIQKSKDLKELKDDKSLSEATKVIVESLYSNLTYNTSKIAKASKILKANPNDDKVRSDALYSSTKTLITLNNGIEELNKQNDVKVKSIIELLRKDLDVINNCNLEVSTISITPQNVSRLQSDLSLILTSTDKIDDLSLSKLKADEKKFIDTTISSIKTFHSKLEGLIPRFEDFPSSGDLVYAIQTIALDAYKKLPDISKTITLQQKASNDPLHQILYERLYSDLNATLIETIPTEEFMKCQHIVQFHQAQAELFQLTNTMHKTGDEDMVKNYNELYTKLQQRTKSVEEIYFDGYEYRKHLHAKPFSQNYIQDAENYIDKVQKSLTHVQNLIFEYPAIGDLDLIIGSVINYFDSAKKALKNTQISYYRPKPSKEFITKATNIIQESIEVLAKILNSDETLTNPMLADQLKSEIEFLQKQKNKIPKIADKTDLFYHTIEKIEEHMNQREIVNAADNQNIPLNNTVRKYKEILKVPPPTIEVTKGCLKEFIPTLDKLQETINNISKSEKVKDNNESQTIFNEWVNAIQQVKHSVSSHINQKDYNDQLALNDKDAILNLQAKISMLPPNIRQLIPKELNEKLAQEISQFVQKGNDAVNCVRHLPNVQMPEIDAKQFHKIDSEAEIQESIPEISIQIREFKNILNEIHASPLLLPHPQTKELVHQMIQNLGKIDEEISNNINNEKLLTEKMTRLRDSLLFVTSTTELISPVLGMNKLHDSAKTIQYNTNNVLRYLMKPHMTPESSKEFEKSLLDTIKKVEKDWNTAKQNIDGLPDNVKTMINALSASLSYANSSLSKMKPRQKQAFCDDLYSSIYTTLPQLFKQSECDDLIDPLLSLFEVTSKFTSKPHVDIRITAPLIINKQILPEETLSGLDDQVVDLIDITNENISGEIYDNYSDSLSMIYDHQDLLPIYVTYASSILQPIFMKHSLNKLIDAQKIISCTDKSAKQRTRHLELSTITTTIKAAKCIETLRNLMKYIDEIFNDSNSFTNDSACYYYKSTQKALQNVDTKMLINCQSISAAILNYSTMHELQTNVSLLIQSTENEKDLDSVIQPIVECFNEYSQLVYQTDLIFSALFHNELSSLICTIDELRLTEKKIPKEVFRKIHGFINDLSTKDYLLYFDPVQMNALSIKYKQFIKESIPIILNNITNKNVILEQQKILSSINPVIQYWERYPNSFDGVRLGNEINSSLYILEKQLSVCQYSMPQQQFIYDFNLPKSQINYIDIISSIDSSINTAAKACSQLFNSITPETFAQQQQVILNSLEHLKGLIGEHYPMNYSDKSINLIESNRVISQKDILLNLIDDKVCLDIAKNAFSQLEQSIKIIQQNQEQQKQKEVDNTKKLELENIQSIGKLSIIDIDQDNIKKNISEALNIEIISQDQQELFITTFLKSSLENMIHSLQQEQLCQFPNILKKINNLNTINIKPNQFEENKNQILRQFETLNNLQKLKEIQSQMTPNQIIENQALLSNIIINLLSPNCKLIFDSYIRQNKDMEQHIFDSLFNYYPNETINSKPINGNPIIHGFSDLILLSQSLISILHEICVVNQQIYKFISTPEGQKVLETPISSQLLLEIQQTIQTLIDLEKSKDNLDMYIKNLSLEQCIRIHRIIYHTLTLINENSINYNFTSTSHNIKQIIRQINIKQQEIIKQNQKALVFEFLDPSLIFRTLYSNAFKITYLYFIIKLISVYNKLISNNPNSKEDIISQDLIKKNLSIIKKLTFLNEKELSNKLNSLSNATEVIQSIQAQLIHLTQSSFIQEISKYVPDFNDAIQQGFQSLLLQEHNNKAISISSQELLVSMSSIQSNNIFNFISKLTLNNSDSQQILKLIEDNPEIKAKLNECEKRMKEITSDQLLSAKIIVSKIHDLYIKSPEEILNQFKPEEILDAYGLMKYELCESIKSIDEHALTVYKKNEIFDRAALIQRQTKDHSYSLIKPDESKTIIENCQKLQTIYDVITDLREIQQLILQENNSFVELSKENIKKLSTNDAMKLQNKINDFYKLNENKDELKALVSQNSIEDNYMIYSLIDDLTNVLQNNIQQVYSDDKLNIISNGISKQKDVDLLNVEINSSDLTKKIEISQEYSNRCALCSQLTLLSAKINELPSMKNAKLVSNSIPLQDVQQANDMAIKLLPIMNSPEAINTMISGVSTQDLTNRLAVINELCQILLPKDQNNNSLFDTELKVLSIDEITNVNLYQKASHIEITNAVVDALTSMIQVFPTMSQLSNDECKEIFVSENTTAIKLLTNLLHSSTPSYSQVKQLIEISPQLITSMTKVILQLNQQLKNKFDDPMRSFELIKKLAISSVDAPNNPKDGTEYRKSLAELLNNLKVAQAVTEMNNKEEDLHEKAMQTIANLHRAIQRRDIEEINGCLIDIQALNVRTNEAGNNIQFIKEVTSKIIGLQPKVLDIYSTQGKLDDQLIKQSDDLCKLLEQIINKETNDPFKTVNEIKSFQSVGKQFVNTKQTLQKYTKSLAKGFQEKDVMATDKSINNIIKLISLMESSAIKGANVSNCKSQQAIKDLLKMTRTTALAIKGLFELKENSAVSLTTVKRSTRSFVRVVDSINDMIDEQEYWDKDKPVEEIDNKKLEFLQNVSKAISFSLSTLTARSEAKIPETYKAIMDKQQNEVKSIIASLKKASESLLKLNKDKSAESDFNNCLNTFITQIELCSSASNTEVESMADNIYVLTGSMTELETALMRLTTIAQLHPDTVNAEKLPRSFEMPSVPDTKISISKANEDLIKFIKEYQTEESKFVSIINTTNNDQLTNKLLDLIPLMEKIVKQILIVSVKTFTLRLQTALTGCATTIVLNFDQLIKGLHSKLLLRGDWSQTSTNTLKQIKLNLDSVLDHSKEAVEISLKESSTRDSYVVKVMAVAQPIQDITTTITDCHKKIESKPSSMTREWAMQTLAIGSSLTNTILKVIMHAKDHPQTQNIDNLLKHGQTISTIIPPLINAVNEIADGKHKEPETIVIEQINKLQTLCKDFLGSIKNDADKTEEKTLNDTLKMILQNAQQLSSMAETSLNNRRAQAKAAAAGGKRTKAGTRQMSAATKTTLLKRLELESRVIKARIILAKNEARLQALDQK